jgi:hypothetical protein
MDGYTHRRHRLHALFIHRSNRHSTGLEYFLPDPPSYKGLVHQTQTDREASKVAALLIKPSQIIIMLCSLVIMSITQAVY